MNRGIPTSERVAVFIQCIDCYSTAKRFELGKTLLQDSMTEFNGSSEEARITLASARLSLLEDDICYVSDTVSYIGAQYVRSKGEHYLDLMTSIVGVSKSFVIDNEKESGGAQYIIKNITADFWSKVYHDSEKLWRMVNEQIKKDKPPHALQIWCADMWAVLWNLWFFDKTVKVSSEMAFSWATSNMADWDKHNIYHNAGVTGDRKDLFFKGAYQSKLPYDIDISTINQNQCVYNYVKEIVKTKHVSCLV